MFEEDWNLYVISFFFCLKLGLTGLCVSPRKDRHACMWTYSDIIKCTSAFK